MYDTYKKCLDYYKLKQMTENLLNGENVSYDAHWLKIKIQESYDKGLLQSWQYDKLIGLLEEIEF